MFDYNWKLKEKNNFSDYHGSTVYSTFSCGGGSSIEAKNIYTSKLINLKNKNFNVME
jgi:hypothetical protein